MWRFVDDAHMQQYKQRPTQCVSQMEARRMQMVSSRWDHHDTNIISLFYHIQSIRSSGHTITIPIRMAWIQNYEITSG